MNTRFVQLFSGETVQTVFKLAYLWLVLLSFNSFFAETVLLSYCSYALALFGAPIVLARVIDFKAYKDMPLIALMCLFLVSFLVSAANTAEYGITSNIQGFAWMTFEFFILFAHSARESAEHAYAELVIIAKSVCWYALVSSCVGLVMGVAGYTESVEVAEGVVNLFGVHQERLWGVYSDPNIGGAVCSISLLFAILLYERGDVGTLFLVVNALAQMGYVAMSGSRGSMLCVAASSFVVFGLLCWRKYDDNSILKRILKSMSTALCGCLIVAVCMLSVGAVLQKTSEFVQSSPGYARPANVISVIYRSAGETSATGSSQSSEVIGLDVQAEEQDAAILDDLEEQTEELVVPTTDSASVNAVDIGYRFIGYGDLGGASAGRFSIWESAIDIIESNPLVGVSHRNILTYTQDTLPDTFIASAGYTTMHNILFDVVVSQGLVGLALFIAMIASGAKRVVVFLKRTKSDGVQSVVLVGVLTVICVASMFYTEILYINSPSSIVFWITLGTMCHVGCDEITRCAQNDELKNKGARL